MKEKQWRKRKRGTPRQIGTPFPLSTPRTPMQVKVFKENLRKLRPRADTPFQAPNPLLQQEAREEIEVEEPLEMVEDVVLQDDGTEARVTRPKVTLRGVYDDAKNTFNAVLEKLGMRKKPKPQLEEIEVGEYGE